MFFVQTLLWLSATGSHISWIHALHSFRTSSCCAPYSRGSFSKVQGEVLQLCWPACFFSKILGGSDVIWTYKLHTCWGWPSQTESVMSQSGRHAWALAKPN